MRYSLVVMGLLLGFSGAAFACYGGPGCSLCEYWDGYDCAPVTCPPCQSCVNGSCQSTCSSFNCESCVNGQCVVCNGDPNKVCCDGQCRDKCQNTAPNGQCDTSRNNDYKCPGCVLGEYGCDTFYTRSYTGMPVRGCSGGCPDDCLSGTVECYDQYKCASTDPLPDHVCMYYPALNQLYCVEYIEHIFCAPCQQDPEDPGEMVFVGDEHCW